MSSSTDGDNTFCFLVMVLPVSEKLHSDMAVEDRIHITGCAPRPIIGNVGTTCVADSSFTT